MLKAGGFFPGDITGGLGPVMTNAVKQFQASNGLSVTGDVDMATWQALPEEDMQGIPTLQQGSSGGAVALAQRCLRRNGFDPGPTNGEFGPSTDAAVRDFQNAMACVVDGVIGDQTWGVLS